MNISDPIARNARVCPDAPAVLNFGAVVTYRELNAVIDALAARFLGMGLAPGDAAGVLVSNRYGLLVLALALARIGVAAVIARDVVKGVGGVPLKACFVEAARAGEIAEGGGVMVDDSWWRSPGAGVATAAVASRPGGKAVCIYVASSGTTGVPKAIALSHELLCSRIYAKWLAVRAPDDARQFCMLGLESYYGFSTVLRVLWTGGLVAAALPWNEMHLAIATYHLNWLVLSPAQLGGLLGAMPADAGPFACLETIEVGGSTLPSSLVAQARARLCNNIYVAYGAAEVAYVAGASAEVLERHPGAVGILASNVEVQAVDANDRPVPAGSEGILRIRSSTAIDGYVGDAQASTAAFRNGWFYPGDVGSISGGGLLTVAGRSGEMINAGGVKVSPRYVEEAILAYPDVGEAAAFAMPNAATGMAEIWAAIVQRSPVNMDALHAHCARRLGDRAPRSILVAKALPRNANGKVLYEELVKLAESAARIVPGPGVRP